MEYVNGMWTEAFCIFPDGPSFIMVSDHFYNNRESLCPGGTASTWTLGDANE